MTRHFGYLKRVLVTPAIYRCFIEFLHFDIQSTGQKSHHVNACLRPSLCFVLIKQSIPLVCTSSKLAAGHWQRRGLFETGVHRYWAAFEDELPKMFECIPSSLYVCVYEYVLDK